MNLNLSASPNVFPLNADFLGDRVLFVRLSEANYAAASFLDEQFLTDVSRSIWRPWPEVAEAVLNPSPRLDFIFHIGHAGSTLLSRLLGDNHRVVSVREPAILRQLACLEPEIAARHSWSPAQFNMRLDVFLHLWSRTFHPARRTLLKTTSSIGDIARLLLSRVPSSRAILMFVAPQVYIAGILGGSASRAQLPNVARSRATRLQRRVEALLVHPADLSMGELAAMSWACELLGLAEVA